jgi:hypothetical protein
MKSVAQVISGQAVTATADTSRIRNDGTARDLSAIPTAVADLGKIRLGGACRMPRKAT